MPKSTITFKYNPFWGYLFLGISIMVLFIFITGLYLKVEINLFNFILPIVGFIYGIQFLKKPYFRINTENIIVYALIGNNVIYFNNFNTENVFIEKEKLYVNIDGKRKWIKVSKFWMGNKEWKKLETYLFKQDLTRELHE